MGWDAYRRQTFERQKEMGIVPLSAELTERPKSLPACGGPEITALQARGMRGKHDLYQSKDDA